MIFELPLKTVSRTNTREHWRNRHKRDKDHRAAAFIAARPYRHLADLLPATVTLTRISPGLLDDDNLPAALKAIRDGIADALLPEHTQGNRRRRWADDSDARLTWKYGQQRQAGKYAVLVQIAPRIIRQQLSDDPDSEVTTIRIN